MTILKRLKDKILDTVNDGANSIIKPEPLTVSEWADKNFYLSSESSYTEGRWQTIPFQVAILNAMGNDDITTIDFIKSARVGYALALGTEIPTKKGFLTMESLCIGDSVFDEEGKPCNVTYKSEVYTDHDCYKIKFDDGSQIIADGGHRWLVDSRTSLGRLFDRFNYFEKTGILTTSELFNHKHYKRHGEPKTRGRFSIKNTKPIHANAKKTGIDLYWLGLWLGDGSASSGSITIGKSDIEEVKRLAIKDGFNNAYVVTDRFGNYNFNVEPATIPRSDCFHKRLVDLDVMHDKKIPFNIFDLSINQRLRLLQGLMDSDGHIVKDGRCEFYNTNTLLTDGVFELCQSLGIKAYIREKTQHGLLPNGTFAKSIKAMHVVGFMPGNKFKVFRNRRKLSRQKPGTGILDRRVIVDIIKIESVPVQCISVDSPSSLFLASKSLIPTHNTKMILATIGYMTEHKKRNQMLWQPTEGAAKEFMKAHVDSMIRDVPVVRDLAPWIGQKNSSNTQDNKVFTNRKQLYVKGGASSKNYREKSVDTVYYDELSSFESNIEKEGSATSLGDKRTEGSAFRKSIRGSTPKIEGDCLISIEAESAEHLFQRFLPCPECNHYQPLIFGGSKFDHGLKWDEGVPSSAHYVCEKCHAQIQNSQLTEMDLQGYWKSENGITTKDSLTFYDLEGGIVDAPEHVAFHIWTIYSPLTSWAQIVKDFYRAKTDQEKFKTFVNTTLGETWKIDAGEQLEWELLYNRREHYIAPVPDGVAYLTCAIDTQDDRFEFEVKGWGADLESWSIDYVQLHGNLTRPEIWGVLSEMITRVYIDRHGREYSAQLITIDSGGHFTSEVYEFSKRMGKKFVVPIKGASIKGRPIESFPNKPMQKEKVFLTIVGTENAKQVVYNQLKLPEVGAGYCHYPIARTHDENYFKMLTAEKYVTRGKTSGWDAGGRRNEAWDCHIYNLVAIKIAIRKFGINLDRLAASLWGVKNEEIVYHSKRPGRKVRKKKPASTNRINGGSLF
jgi:phage terminase large subunit GpA-like protein